MEIYNFPSFMHWLLIVNASTNFLIYCFMGNKFKTVLMSMVRDLIKGKEQTTSMVMMVDAAGVKRDISKVNAFCLTMMILSIILQATTLTVAVSPIPAREPEEVNLIVPPTITEVTIAMMMLVMRRMMLNYDDESDF